MNRTAIVLLLLLSGMASLCSAADQAEPKKVLLINSYHLGYPWSDNIEVGFRKSTEVQTRADGTLFSDIHNFELRILRMDTKNNRAEAFKKKAAAQARAVIEDWAPDLLIACDDNASKYLIAPYYKNTAIPVVFCGINWDATVYGFPCQNITGIVETEPVRETIAMMQEHANGERLGYIGADTLSTHKIITQYRDVLHIEFADGELVNTFDEWKAVHLRLQKTTDMFLFIGKEGIQGWDDDEAIRFIKENAAVPIGGTSDHHTPFSMFGQIKIAEEQGWQAGMMAIQILNGTPPADIPVRTNRANQVFVNMPLVNALGIKLPIELLEKASLKQPPSP
jgi:hypothetical protein